MDGHKAGKTHYSVDLGIRTHNGRLPWKNVNKRRKMVIAFGVSELTASFGAFSQQQSKVWRVGFLKKLRCNRIRFTDAERVLLARKAKAVAPRECRPFPINNQK